MEQLQNYIHLARQQGLGDDQIRQNLLNTGWLSELVNAALPPSTAPRAANPYVPPVQAPTFQSSVYAAPATPGQVAAAYPAQSTSLIRSLRLPLIILGSVVLLIGIIALIVTFSHKTPYETVLQQFVSAVQHDDKTTADKLESPAAQAFFNKNTGTSSIYGACKEAGDVCTGIFKESYLSKTTKTYKDYTAKNGKKGKQVVYTAKKTIQGEPAGGPGCTATSISTLSIAVVPKGRSWQVDNLDQSYDAGSSFCITPGAGGTGS